MAGRKKGAPERPPRRSRQDPAPTEQTAVMPKAPMRPAQCRAYMRGVLAREFPGIVEGFVQEAKSGSCQHVKLATELMKPTTKAKARRKGRVQELLEQLQREAG